MSAEQLERPEAELETEPATTIEEDVGAQLADAVREGAEGLNMSEFTEPSAQAAHGHSPDKGEGSHDLRGAFNVSEDFIRENFKGGVVPNGHEAVHALLAGKQSFIAADEDIFTDTHDTDEARWQEIRETADRAPIPPGRRSVLDASYA